MIQSFFDKKDCFFRFFRQQSTIIRKMFKFYKKRKDTHSSSVFSFYLLFSPNVCYYEIDIQIANIIFSYKLKKQIKKPQSTDFQKLVVWPPTQLFENLPGRQEV